MKLSFRIAAIAVACGLALLAGCSSNGAGGGDDGGGGGGAGDIAGTISGWSLGASHTIEARDFNDDTVIYGTSAIAADGSFSIDLRTPTTAETSPVSSLSILSTDMTISNESANYATIQELTVVDSSDQVVGTVDYRASNTSATRLQHWYYSDGPTTIAGSVQFLVTITYDSLSLVRGWTNVDQSTDNSTSATTIDNGTVTGGAWEYYADAM